MKIIGNVISLFGLYLIYSVTFGSPDRMSGAGIDWGVAIPIMVVGLAIAAFGSHLAQSALEEQQQTQTADGRFDALYLRPFDLDSKFIVKRKSNLFDWDKFDRPGIDAWERVLADALSRSAMLRGLGVPGEVTIGPRLDGLVSDWQKEIGSSLARSDYVFVIPSANPGTLWELRQIKAWNLFSKTIFIMPPTCYPFEYKGEAPFVDVWHKTVETCRAELQLELPPYQEIGALFCFRDGELKLKDLTDYSPKSVARAINHLLR